MLADPYNKIIQVKKIAEPITVTLINFIVNNIAFEDLKYFLASLKACDILPALPVCSKITMT
jgi:hypothetical protein